MNRWLPFSYLQRRTLVRGFKLDGIGLHSGDISTVKLYPGSNGIRLWSDDKFHEVSNLRSLQMPRCSGFAFPSGREVVMVEHMLASFRIIGMTDVDIEIIGNEIPIFDGSSLPWLSAINSAGIKCIKSPSDIYIVTQKYSCNIGTSEFSVSPGPFELTCDIDYPNTPIGSQRIHIDEGELFSLIPARTFVLYNEVQGLINNHLALGGSLDNALVIGAEGPLNQEGYRVSNECVRHKALDFMGDLMMVGVPIIGSFSVSRPGHSNNAEFLDQLIQSNAIKKLGSIASVKQYSLQNFDLAQFGNAISYGHQL